MGTIKIQGMTCIHCVRAVTRALSAVPGVERVVAVDLALGEARIEGAPNVEAALAALRNEGYEASWRP